MTAPVQSGYRDAQLAALMAPVLYADAKKKCRDLTDEEVENPDYDGCGYRDSQKAAEEAEWQEKLIEEERQRQEEADIGTLAAQSIFEGEDGTIYILDDEGEIHEVKT